MNSVHSVILSQVEYILNTFVKSNDAFVDGHNLEHFYKVKENAMKALVYENDLTSIQCTQILIACLLHDLDDHKLFPNNNNNENARVVLGFIQDIAFLQPIFDMINLVSCSDNGDSEPLYKWMAIPRDCDRLEAMGEIGIRRAEIYAEQVGNAKHNDNTKRAYSIEELDLIVTEERFKGYQVRKKSDTFIDHFYDKILHIGKPSKLKSQNPYILQEAERLTKITQDYVINYWLKHISLGLMSL